MEGSGLGIPAPLDEVPQDRLVFYDRVLLASGLELQRGVARSDGSSWEALGSHGHEAVDRATAAQPLSAGPVCVAIRDAWGDCRWFGVGRTRGPVLELQWQALHQSGFGTVERGGKGNGQDMVYVIGAVLYHLRNLGAVYSEIIRRVFAQPPFELFSGPRVVLSGEVEPYYEVEALITAVTRSYETARYFIWSAFGPGTDVPRNFEGVLNSVQLPEGLHGPSLSWRASYTRAKDYRDCIQHNAHFGARLPFSMANQIDGFWGLLNRLPDNPEVKSYRGFTCAANVDALAYGWGIANDVVDMTRVLFQTVRVDAT